MQTTSNLMIESNQSNDKQEQMTSPMMVDETNDSSQSNRENNQSESLSLLREDQAHTFPALNHRLEQMENDFERIQKEIRENIQQAQAQCEETDRLLQGIMTLINSAEIE